MPVAGFKPTIPARERPQAHALDSAVHWYRQRYLLPPKRTSDSFTLDYQATRRHIAEYFTVHTHHSENRARVKLIMC
jgi:hypothetical protein